MEREWARIVLEKDAGAAFELLHDDFVLVSEGGVGPAVDRDAWLASLPRIDTRSLAVTEATARVFGDTAVVRARLRWDATLGDRDLTDDYVCADTFVRDGGRWRVIWRISTRVAA